MGRWWMEIGPSCWWPGLSVKMKGTQTARRHGIAQISGGSSDTEDIWKWKRWRKHQRCWWPTGAGGSLCHLAATLIQQSLLLDAWGSAAPHLSLQPLCWSQPGWAKDECKGRGGMNVLSVKPDKPTSTGVSPSETLAGPVFWLQNTVWHNGGFQLGLPTLRGFTNKNGQKEACLRWGISAKSTNGTGLEQDYSNRENLDDRVLSFFVGPRDRVMEKSWILLNLLISFFKLQFPFHILVHLIMKCWWKELGDIMWELKLRRGGWHGRPNRRCTACRPVPSTSRGELGWFSRRARGDPTGRESVCTVEKKKKELKVNHGGWVQRTEWGCCLLPECKEGELGSHAFH